MMKEDHPLFAVRPRRWEGNIIWIAGRLRCESGRWIELAQDDIQWQAVVLAVLNLWVLLW